METASFIGFFKTLLYIMAFYYIFKFLARIFLPILLKKAVEKAGSNFQQQQQTKDNSWNKTSSAGDIYYKPPTSGNPKSTKKVGDYVDYEEID
ncbi:DUF4834 family protein [Flavobacterium sp. UMI-01]|uniref:DUF4834 family protein n=1 Tax=Flavobacterium sp. UMI-01 TaxID=1441053 RepID=UPI001C7DD1AB|nr:DUF4834 family protein [Flavobacterium sp. UMI-01]GIZ10521.1 hypothetical protein FUMI01_32450 [Flavobacterium sp. UMI-01]